MKRNLNWLLLLGLSACGGAASSGASANAVQAMVPPQKQAADAYHEATVAGQHGEWAKAAELFTVAARLDPSFTLAHLNHAIAVERSGNVPLAIDAYRSVLAAEPGMPEASIHLARALVAVGDAVSGLSVVEESLKIHPEDFALLNAEASLLRQNKQYDRAADAARKVLLRDQKNVAAIKNLALIYADQNKLQLAETFFQNALKLDANDASIHVNLGLLAHRRGDHQAAIAAFEKALTLNPNDARAHANIGAIALKYRDYKRAVTEYRSAITLGLVTCETQSALGFALEGASDSKAAISQLESAHDMCPKDAELLFTIGSVCMSQLRDNTCALKNFERYTSTKEGLSKEHRVFQFINALKASSAAPPPAEPTAPAVAPASDAPPAG